MSAGQVEPYRVLEVTTMRDCGIGCTYCPQNESHMAHVSMPSTRALTLATFRSCLESVPRTVDISFSGYAEPWLNPECTAMVEAAHARGHGVRIFSTLVGMTPDDVQRLSRIPIKLFVVHVFDDGAHMPTRFVNDRYLDCVRSVLIYRWQDLRFLLFGNAHATLIDLLHGQRVVTSRPLISRAGNVRRDIVSHPSQLIGPLYCAERREFRNVLLPDGTVRLCCMDYGGKHVLGNLLSQNYDDLFSGTEFQAVQRMMGGEAGHLLCRSCECAVSSMHEPGA